MKLPGWSCAASYFFITTHTAEYLMARNYQGTVRAAGVASSLIRNTGVKEGQAVCAAYIHMYTASLTVLQLSYPHVMKVLWGPSVRYGGVRGCLESQDSRLQNAQTDCIHGQWRRDLKHKAYHEHI
eukprot:1161671-Pelagomonas_calceolata.AAC.22